MTASEQQNLRGAAASEPARHEPKLVMDSVGLCYSQGGLIPSRRTMTWAIRDVSLTLERGETLGVIGYNGAGKSSLLRLIAGIIEPDRGTINRFGNSAALLSFGAGFEPRLTGRQNIMLSGLQLGMPRGLIRDHTEKIIELADIGEHIDRPVRAYSTGMRARLGFAIAYFVETDILLIDEVLATGDEAFRAKASELIMQRIDSDLSVVIVSHAMPMILRLCTRVVQIENGVSLPEISPEESVQRYRSVRLGQPA